ncbi:MAG: hypothetical protein WB508_10895 [Aeromicrobium sp.]|uniref:sulfurtransferase TusA family protein n=1 Tax=Aeromicrobium sp. TaxID=1871063 RepID=UPI003C5922C3
MTTTRVLVEGGDRACGELLLVLAARARELGPDTHLRLIATDPAAPIDLPAWCHLTGHIYLGHGMQDDGRPHYDVQTVTSRRDVLPHHPWRLQSSPSASPTITGKDIHP